LKRNGAIAAAHVSERRTWDVEQGPRRIELLGGGTWREARPRNKWTLCSQLAVSAALQGLHQHLRLPAAPIVEVATSGWKVVRRAGVKSALVDEEVEGLRGQTVEDLESEGAGLFFRVLDQLRADPAVLVSGIDVNAGHLRLLLGRVHMQRAASDRVFVHLEYEEVVDGPLDIGPCALEQFVRLDAALDQGEDRPNVFLLRLADRLIFVGVDERTDAFVGEDFGEQAFGHGSVDHVDPRDAGAGRLNRVLQFGDRLGRSDVAATLLEDVGGLFGR